MTDYLDTSALIRAWRLSIVPEGITRAHSIAEFYCVLTGPGIVMVREGRTVKARLAPLVAAAAAARTFAKMSYRDVKAAEAIDSLPFAAQENVQGRNIHDWMHVEAANLSHAQHLVTLNEKDFRKMTKMKLVSPEDYF